jgi:hypothetical protein
VGLELETFELQVDIPLVKHLVIQVEPLAALFVVFESSSRFDMLIKWGE